MLYLCVSSPMQHHYGLGFSPLGSSLKYRLSCAVLQKHLNLRWQECVQLISSTVAPSSGFLLHNTEHHRKSRANTLKHNRYRLRGAVPVCPVHCHYLLWCCESHPLLCSYTDTGCGDYTLYIINTLTGETCTHTAAHKHTPAYFDLFLTIYLILVLVIFFPRLS